MGTYWLPTDETLQIIELDSDQLNRPVHQKNLNPVHFLRSTSQSRGCDILVTGHVVRGRLQHPHCGGDTNRSAVRKTCQYYIH